MLGALLRPAAGRDEAAHIGDHEGRRDVKFEFMFTIGLRHGLHCAQ